MGVAIPEGFRALSADEQKSAIRSAQLAADLEGLRRERDLLDQRIEELTLVNDDKKKKYPAGELKVLEDGTWYVKV